MRIDCFFLLLSSRGSWAPVGAMTGPRTSVRTPKNFIFVGHPSFMDGIELYERQPNHFLCLHSNSWIRKNSRLFDKKTVISLSIGWNYVESSAESISLLVDNNTNLIEKLPKPTTSPPTTRPAKTTPALRMRILTAYGYTMKDILCSEQAREDMLEGERVRSEEKSYHQQEEEEDIKTFKWPRLKLSPTCQRKSIHKDTLPCRKKPLFDRFLPFPPRRQRKQLNARAKSMWHLLRCITEVAQLQLFSQVPKVINLRRIGSP